ncbi:hypothetical protein GF312_04245 [Candidatus Poribacteria bacterium]|nr:hypothetical protein [Candidatus Poribacteria bacterium]
MKSLFKIGVPLHIFLSSIIVLTTLEILLICSSIFADEGITMDIHINGDKELTEIKVLEKHGLFYIPVNDDILDNLKIEIKKFDEKNIGICKDEICIFANLDNQQDALIKDNDLMINIELIAQAFNSEIEWIIKPAIVNFVTQDRVLLDNIIEIGDVVPDFALPSIKGESIIPFSSFRGKRVLLFLWASW